VRVVVVALGKIGLPLAAHVARAGHDVVGCDIDPAVVEAVNAGRPPFPGERGLEDALAEVVGAGRLRAQADTTAAVAEGPELVVAVPPLLIDDEARLDFEAIDAVCDAIGRGLRPGATVSVETTMPVGTTRGRIAPRLAELSGLALEEELWVVHSPERVYSGRVFRDLDTYPKLVGGLGPGGEERAAELYRAFIAPEVRLMGSAEAAELTKVAEATYRHLNIALANELARFGDRAGVDIHRVIDAANSQPFSHLHRPGVAVGGHCTPVYPHFWLRSDPEARLSRVADEVNRSMPAYAVERLAGALGELEGRRVLVLGVAYRGGVKETAFSGAFGLRDELERRGAVPVVADPLFSAEELERAGFAPWAGEDVDGAILQADHGEYRRLRPADVPGARAVVDGRDALDRAPLEAAGIAVVGIGRP
jgi:UDP-N-acetyl-D-mannosaminuronic acid dehydrogenase